jgi:hypothetical protein
MSTYRVQYKRTARCRTFRYRDLPADWSENDARTYAMSLTELHPDVDVWLWKNNETVVIIYRNGKIA